MKRINLASDNYAGIHPLILQALTDSNNSDCSPYGHDRWTEEAGEKFREHFGSSVEVYFVSTGTAANVLGISTFLPPYGGVIAAQSSHINTDECGAFEHYTGCKILSVATNTGKLSLQDLAVYLNQRGNVHRVQPVMVSVSQPTELGILYSVAELRELADYAHAHGLIVHMDGARLCNAAAALGVSLRALTADCGIDVLSFGGTKNGMMMGDAVVFFDSTRARDFPFVRKQGMQLASKMRFISAQFSALLSNDLWLKNATHANAMAQLLKEGLKEVEEIIFAYPLYTNALFARVAHESIIETLLKQYAFYIWDPTYLEVRWMTSFATREEEIGGFVDAVKKACLSYRTRC
ncbi:low specificity L-threonine aldolase [Candidatus Dependentiae bacterium]|nr:low specificity L-threonine aldolase [Candidatus Dependentiae bacterium]